MPPASRDNSIRTRPLFTGEYVAFSSFDRYALRALIQKIDKPWKRILEIGSWIGNGSTRTIIEMIQGRGMLYCVDHWQGNDNVPRHHELVAHFDILNTFRANVNLYGGVEFVKPLVMSSSEAAAILRDRSFDLIFIDGTHSYESTKMDIEQWLPKVVEGGILCGHDCEARAGNFDRKFLWQNRDCDTVEAQGPFPCIHPGVVLAVDEKFGSAAHLWSENVIQIEDGSHGQSTIWDFTVATLK
jgi:predicted O-methyltransferase YrrM